MIDYETYCKIRDHRGRLGLSTPMATSNSSTCGQVKIPHLTWS
jgi:hypothetical protein